MLPITNNTSKQSLHPFQTRIQSRVNEFFDTRIAVTWGGMHLIDRDPPKPGAVNLSTNDYLNLSHHPRIAAAIRNQLASEHHSTLMSSLFLAKGGIQRTFEQEFAQLLGCESSVLCQSGWAANVGLIQSIADETTNVYIDFLAHMSLWEGIRSARATPKPFRHNSPDHLRRLLKQNGPGIIVVDSVYSTDGTICPLQEIVDLAGEYGCALVVDESHSIGTHGPKGSGLVCELGLEDRVDFRTFSLAKAFAGRGGLITCTERFREYFLMESLPSIFSSALLPHEVAGFLETLKVIQQADKPRRQLQCNAQRLRDGLNELGFDTLGTETQIVCLMGGPEVNTLLMRQQLVKYDIHGAPFGPPATPANRSLMRFTVRSDVSDSDIDRVIAACATLLGKPYQPQMQKIRRHARPRRILTGPSRLTHPPINPGHGNVGNRIPPVAENTV
ncbi:MAG: quorum-sensing autoinducer CAI-1 synthase [Chromatiales bacterium]|nr:quorum-sensing autoinducer CAI-1 synthase [Chromatiales bacterium]